MDRLPFLYAPENHKLKTPAAMFGRQGDGFLTRIGLRRFGNKSHLAAFSNCKDITSGVLA